MWTRRASEEKTIPATARRAIRKRMSIGIVAATGAAKKKAAALMRCCPSVHLLEV
jgi:hypothetical protein